MSDQKVGRINFHPNLPMSEQPHASQLPNGYSTQNSEFHTVESFQRRIADLEGQLEKVKQELFVEQSNKIEPICRKPCYSNREGVKCTESPYYLCFHCKQWFCDSHGALHFGANLEHEEKRPTTCLLKRIKELEAANASLTAERDKLLAKMESSTRTMKAMLAKGGGRSYETLLQERDSLKRQLESRGGKYV